AIPVARGAAKARAHRREDGLAEIAADFAGRQLTEWRSRVAHGRDRRWRRHGARSLGRGGGVDPRVHPVGDEVHAREETGKAHAALLFHRARDSDLYRSSIRTRRHEWAAAVAVAGPHREVTRVDRAEHPGGLERGVQLRRLVTAVRRALQHNRPRLQRRLWIL